jgi:hypothetical protein
VCQSVDLIEVLAKAVHKPADFFRGTRHGEKPKMVPKAPYPLAAVVEPPFAKAFPQRGAPGGGRPEAGG